MAEGSRPVTIKAPSSVVCTDPPAARSRGETASGIGVRSRTTLVAPLTRASTVESAMRWPLPMTMTRVAVKAISLIRWLETKTVRP